MVKWKNMLLTLLVFGFLVANFPGGMAQSTHTPDVQSIVAGHYCSFAVMDDGTIWAWGENTQGQLGNISSQAQHYPSQIVIDNVKEIASGAGVTLALKNDGTVWGWGSNVCGQLGDGTTVSGFDPVQVKGLSNVVAIAAGGGQCLALKDDATVWAWGRGLRGELGVGTRNPVPDNGHLEDYIVITTPVKVNISNVKAICCGRTYSTALKNDGTVWAWGEGDEGGIGDGSFNDAYVPTQVSISNVTAISCTVQHTLALKDDGTVWGWGWNINYQLGNVTDGYYQNTPVKVNDLEDIVQVSAGGWFSLALKRDGTVWAWGENQEGRMGNGYMFGTDIINPIPVEDMAGIRRISAGEGHGLALRDDGTVWAWGRNYEGQIGNGQTLTNINGWNGVPTPVQVIIGHERPASMTARPYDAVQGGTPTIKPVVIQAPDQVPFSAKAEELWSKEYSGPIQYIAEGDNGNIYAFGRNDIYCMGIDGKQKWNLTIPGEWSICNLRISAVMPERHDTAGAFEAPWPVYGESNGYLYVYAIKSELSDMALWTDEQRANVNTNGQNWSIFAISPEGKILWRLPLNTSFTGTDDTVINAIGDRIYVFHSYNETVIDKNGSVIYTIPNVASPAAIDENGNVYTVVAVPRNWSEYDTRIASTIVSAHDSYGKPLWSKDTGKLIIQQYIIQELRSEYGSLPVYSEDTLLVPVRRGIVALDTSGNEKWSVDMKDGNYRLFNLMPLDTKGNIYLTRDNPFSPESTLIYIISNDGKNISEPREFRNKYNLKIHVSARDGIIYDVSENVVSKHVPANISDLMAYTIKAYDIINNTMLWTYNLSISTMHTATLDKDNIKDILGEYTAYHIPEQATQQQSPDKILSMPELYIYSSNDLVLVNARSINYEAPVVPGLSKCVYSSEIYAFSPTGSLLYDRPLDQFAAAAVANNSTIIFGMRGGEIAAVSIVAVTGIALLAALALCVKFLLAGTVTRGRTRLNKNENRNLVLAYIREHPGQTMYEISRGIEINMGTVRYHVFILGLNHKIATFNDGKFVRYFPNSNFYTHEEQTVISLMRREPIRKIVYALLQTPGMTNAELAKETGQPGSAVSKHMKELCVKGIGVKNESSDGENNNKISDAYISLIKNLESKKSL